MHLSDTLAREALRRMLRIRGFEEATKRLIKLGAIADVHTSIGQEATIVGTCLALRDDDFITGTHRSHGHPIGKGAELPRLMAELLGKATGICGGRGGSMHLADTKVGVISESAIVGGGIPLATGSGLSAKVRSSDQVTVCFFGDGAVNQGTFHESLNMASLWKLPVVYVCENNGYAISTSLSTSHSNPDIASKAKAYAMPGHAVDGQDLVAVYDAAASAVSRARLGHGPTLLELKTYRFDEHCIPLHIPGPAYRSQEEIDFHRRHRDPISLFRAVLARDGWADSDIRSVEDDVHEEVEAALRFATESRFPLPEELHDHVLSTSTSEMAAQA